MSTELFHDPTIVSLQCLTDHVFGEKMADQLQNSHANEIAINQNGEFRQETTGNYRLLNKWRIQKSNHVDKLTEDEGSNHSVISE